MNENLLKVLEKIFSDQELAKKFFKLKNLEDVYDFLKKFDNNFTIEDLEHIIDEQSKNKFSNIKLEDEKLTEVAGGNKITDITKKILSTGIATLTIFNPILSINSFANEPNSDNEISTKTKKVLAITGGITVPVILTLAYLGLSGNSQNKPKNKFSNKPKQASQNVKIDIANHNRIFIVQGSITKLRSNQNIQADAIVNAANSELLGGGGVCGAIFSAAGSNLQKECNSFPYLPKGTKGNEVSLMGSDIEKAKCKIGDAVITDSCDLIKEGVKKIIHTPGPRYSEHHNDWMDLLAKCYQNSIARAQENGCKSIAFPSISTNIFGCPLEKASKTAVKATDKILSTQGFEDMQVYFVCQGETFDRYKGILPQCRAIGKGERI